MQQAAANLLDNSLKHTPAGGSVTLRAAPHFWERRVAGVTPTPGTAALSVATSEQRGSLRDGYRAREFRAEHHQEIFEDFVRVDRNTSGMGLGLAIAKRLIQAHRGKIWVESEARNAAARLHFCCRWTRVSLRKHF